MNNIYMDSAEKRSEEREGRSHEEEDQGTFQSELAGKEGRQLTCSPMIYVIKETGAEN